MHVCIYIFIINIHSTHTYILCKQIILDVINRLTAQRTINMPYIGCLLEYTKSVAKLTKQKPARIK